MSDLDGTQIVGFLAQRLIYQVFRIISNIPYMLITILSVLNACQCFEYHALNTVVFIV